MVELPVKSRKVKYEPDSYDSDLIKLVPAYSSLSESLQVLLSNLTKLMSIDSVLDLGTGTGRLIFECHQAGISAQFTGVDFDSEMLAFAVERASSIEEVDFIKGDILNDVLWTSRFGKSQFSLIISGLTFHHFDQSEKEWLYQQIHESLVDGGVFLNQDMFCASTCELSDFYLQEELAFMRENKVGKEWIDHYTSHDTLNDVSKEFQLLMSCGFQQVDCHFRHLQNGIIVAYK